MLRQSTIQNPPRPTPRGWQVMPNTTSRRFADDKHTYKANLGAGWRT